MENSQYERLDDFWEERNNKSNSFSLYDCEGMKPEDNWSFQVNQTYNKLDYIPKTQHLAHPYESSISQMDLFRCEQPSKYETTQKTSNVTPEIPDIKALASSPFAIEMNTTNRAKESMKRAQNSIVGEDIQQCWLKSKDVTSMPVPTRRKSLKPCANSGDLSLVEKIENNSEASICKYEKKMHSVDDQLDSIFKSRKERSRDLSKRRDVVSKIILRAFKRFFVKLFSNVHSKIKLRINRHYELVEATIERAQQIGLILSPELESQEYIDLVCWLSISKNTSKVKEMFHNSSQTIDVMQKILTKYSYISIISFMRIF